jgi:hypothetical protein
VYWSWWHGYYLLVIEPSRQNILAQQRWRNGPETWRRRSCQCEHLRLITHENTSLNGDIKSVIPRRNGNVTYSVPIGVHL